MAPAPPRQAGRRRHLKSVARSGSNDLALLSSIPTNLAVSGADALPAVALIHAAATGERLHYHSVGAGRLGRTSPGLAWLPQMPTPSTLQWQQRQRQTEEGGRQRGLQAQAQAQAQAAQQQQQQQRGGRRTGAAWGL